MKLPNGHHAIVDEIKLTGYCLNHHHPRGKHKARVFAAAGVSDAAVLKAALIHAAKDNHAEIVADDDFGSRYTIDFCLYRVEIRSVWIIRKNEDAPRLVTCYIL